MRESEKRLFQTAIKQATKIGAVVLFVLFVVYFLPPDTPRKIGIWWENTKKTFRERHQPFYEFLVGKDMERAKGQYGQFKK